MFAPVQWVVATSIGLLDACGHFNRVSLLVGSDVYEVLHTKRLYCGLTGVARSIGIHCEGSACSARKISAS